MNITWHIIRKDLSRFWLGILFLVGLVALKIVLITGIFSAEVTREWAGRMMRYQSLLLISQWFLSYFVAVAVVHEDPVSEPGAFWATLPISRRQLLGAKLLGVIIICALPVLLTLAMGWIAVGLPINLLGWPLTVVAEAQLGLCLLAFAFASLTKNTAHLIFWMIGVTLTPFIPVIFPELFRHGQGVLTPGARFTRLFMANLIWVVTAVAVMLNQYLGQSRKRSIVFLALGLGLGVYAATFPFSGALLPGQHRLDNEIAGLSADITQAVLAKPKPDADATSLIRISLKQILPNLVIYPYYVV